MADNPLVASLRAPKNLVFLAVLALGLAADQATKWWVQNNIRLHTGEIQLVKGWLSLVHERNTGAAFSSFEGKFWLFMAFTLVAVGVLVSMQRALKPSSMFMGATLGLILSGALGNFIDRVRFRYVTDFVRCYTDHPPFVKQLADWGLPNTYPIWNVADAAILVGVVSFLLYSTFYAEEEPEASSDATPEPAAVQSS